MQKAIAAKTAGGSSKTRHLVLGCVVVLALSASAEPSPENSAAEQSVLDGRVVAIADGDTLTLLVGQTQFRIRLAQIDTPESHQPYGKTAKQALAALVFGKDVRVVVIDTDRYGRSVGEVFVEGLHVNQEMVRQGHAWAYTKYSRSVDIIELEDEARAASRGLWALPPEQREPPWSWRRRKRGRAATQPVLDSLPRVCGNRTTCREMTTCEEARFYLETCGLTRLDGDRDGVPCEALCGGESRR